MSMFLKAILICWLYFVGSCLSLGCKRLYTNDTHLPVPVFQHDRGYRLAELHNGFLTLSKYQQVLFICSGTRNHLIIANQEYSFSEVNATCVSPNIVTIHKKKFNINTIFCTKKVRADVRKTRQRCSAAFMYEIGYNIITGQWLPLIKICHNSSSGNTVYTNHILDASTLNVSAKIPRLSQFSLEGFNTSVPISISYKKTVQRIRFSNHLKSPLLAEIYITNTSYLARGHLTPHADFSMASSQASTYYYLNTAPTWQTLNTGIWKSVENIVRKLSLQHGPLNVTTGTFGILNYPNKQNEPTDIYLAANQIPVPKYIWKIAYDPNKGKAIVFVMLNDPFARDRTIHTCFCSDVCRDNGYINTGLKQDTKGLVGCCSYGEFINIVKYRLNLRVTGILEYKRN